MKKILFIMTLLWGGFTASSIKAQIDVNKVFPNAVMSKEIYDKAKAELDKPESPFKTLFETAIKAESDKNLNQATWWKANYNDATQADKDYIVREMNRIYYHCVTYLMTGEQKYLDKAADNLKEWTKGNVANHRSNINEHYYPPAVEGYSIIRNVISEADRKTIDNWVNKRLQVFKSDNDLRINNWGTCLLFQFYLYGTVLGDEDALNYFNTNYPEWVKQNLFPNGTTTDLLGRDAFAYHAYDLQLFAKICHLKAILEGYEVADVFYAQDVNWGASIKRSVDFWKPFILEPTKYTHVEFVNTEYAPDKNRSDYNNTYNPGGTVYAVDELYEMDRDLKRVIDKYRSNEFATWRLGLSALRWK